MKSKKWKDCPSCGAKDSMVLRKGINQSLSPKGYKSFSVSNLEGYTCKICGETILTPASEKQFDSSVAEELATQDSQRIVASELAEVDEVAKVLSISRQRVHQMMIEGKIRYVFIGSKRYPIRASIGVVKPRRKTNTFQSKSRTTSKIANGV